MRRILSTLFLLCLCCSVWSQRVGDVNVDGVVDVGDVNSIINIILGKPTPIPNSETIIIGLSVKMIKVEGGTFMMGTDDPSDLSNAKPSHQVTLDDYYIAETEVTQELWQYVMGDNPSYSPMGGCYPVQNVSWDECQVFIEKLNILTGKSFRLPTEAEWEFAARGGIYSKGYIYSGSNDFDEVGWSAENSTFYHMVAQKMPNELGIYDMSGNVSEFCSNWFYMYSDAPIVNPSGPDEGTYKVARGGNWVGSKRGCTVVSRCQYLPANKGGNFGLRLAM